MSDTHLACTDVRVSPSLRSRLIRDLVLYAVVALGLMVFFTLALKLDDAYLLALVFAVPAAFPRFPIPKPGSGHPGTLRVIGHELFFGDESVHVPRKLGIAEEGCVSPLRSEIQLRLVSGARVLGHVAHIPDAEAFLIAAGLDAGQRPLRFRLGDTRFLDWMAAFVGLIITAVVSAALRIMVEVSGQMMLIELVALTAVLLVLFRRALGPAEVVVGLEGLELRRALGTSHLPFHELGSFNTRPNALEITRSNGATETIKGRNWTLADQAMFKARVEEARASFHARAEVAKR